MHDHAAPAACWRRRDALVLLARCTVPALPLMAPPTALADASDPALASYYDRHMALAGGVAWGWLGSGAPQKLVDGVRAVGVSRDAYYALRDAGELIRWTGAAQRAAALMRGVAAFAAGQSGWFAIDAEAALWYAPGDSGAGDAPRRAAGGAIAACVGDSADYYIAHDGTLFAKGLAHRGQYGDGRLAATPDFTATARDAVAVRAHTGHAIHLRRDGVVMGTGGNRYGPLSSHGLGDKADRWGPIFDGAAAIATGSRHSAAIRADGSLWVWGDGFAIEPRALLREGVVAVAAGDTVTLARLADGSLLQWDRGTGPRRLVLR